MIYKRLYTVLAILSVLSSCTKIQTTDIGSGLIPPIDGVITKDTLLDVFTSNFIDADSARVYKNNDNVIGVITNDPLFGTTTASSFFELKPTYYPFSFQGNYNDLKADSVVLILKYKGVYGDSTIPQTWRVFEVTGNFRNDSNYASNYSSIQIGNQLGIKSGFDIRKLGDSVHNNYENTNNQIRIKFDNNNSFGNRLLKYDSTSRGTNNAYYNDSIFRTKLKGLAVVPDQVGNALIQVNLSDTTSKLAIYYSYKTATTPAKDTSTVSYFRFITDLTTPTSASANLIKRQYSTNLTQYINPTKNDSLAFVQTSPGTYVQVKIPGLAGFPNALIHHAELIAEQVPDKSILDGYLSPPRYLLLSADSTIGTTKTKFNIPNDYVVDASGINNIASFGGFLSYKTIGATQVAAYDFNLTRYVQGIITRKEPSYTLRISAPSNDSLRYKDPFPATIFNTYYLSPDIANIIAEGRVRLGGGTHSKYRMRLRIIYSRL